MAAKKKKALLDHRSPGWAVNYYRPTSEDADSLAEKYGFMSDFPLRDRLESAYSGEETVQYHAEHNYPLSEQKELLKALHKRCHAVEEVIGKLGHKEKKLLAEEDSNLPDLKEFKENAHKVFMASLCALQRIKNQKSARPKKRNVWYFVWHLADVWLEGTGKEPTCSYNESKGCFVGDFYPFACECARLGAIKLAVSGDPGPLIRDILRERRSRQNKEE